jgi:hypothetical protein
MRREGKSRIISVSLSLQVVTILAAIDGNRPDFKPPGPSAATGSSGMPCGLFPARYIPAMEVDITLLAFCLTRAVIKTHPRTHSSSREQIMRNISI